MSNVNVMLKQQMRTVVVVVVVCLFLWELQQQNGWNSISSESGSPSNSTSTSIKSSTSGIPEEEHPLPASATEETSNNSPSSSATPPLSSSLSNMDKMVRRAKKCIKSKAKTKKDERNEVFRARSSNGAERRLVKEKDKSTVPVLESIYDEKESREKTEQEKEGRDGNTVMEEKIVRSVVEGRPLPLLEPSPAQNISKSEYGADPSLEEIFPELMNNLRRFDSSMKPAWRTGDIQVGDPTAGAGGCATVGGTNLGVPIFRLPQMATSLPGSAASEDANNNLQLNSNQNQRGDHLQAPQLLQASASQMFKLSFNEFCQSPDPTERPALVNQISHHTPPTRQQEVKFPFLLPPDFSTHPSFSSHSRNPVHLPFLPSEPPSSLRSMPSQAPPTFATRSQLNPPPAPPPEPPQLFQVPEVYPTRVLASLLVSPQQLLEQQQRELSHVATPSSSQPPRLHADGQFAGELAPVSKQSRKCDVQSEAPVQPVKAEASGDDFESSLSISSLSSLLSEPTQSVAENLVKQETPTEVRRKKPKSQKAKSKSKKPVGSSSRNQDLVAQSVAMVKRGISTSSSEITFEEENTCDTPTDSTLTEAGEDEERLSLDDTLTTELKPQSEGEKSMKKMLKGAQESSKKLKEPESPPVLTPTLKGMVKKCEASSGGVSDLPEMLEPLTSLEVRRLNVYKISQDLEEPAVSNEGEPNGKITKTETRLMCEQVQHPDSGHDLVASGMSSLMSSSASLDFQDVTPSAGLNSTVVPDRRPSSSLSSGQADKVIHTVEASDHVIIPRQPPQSSQLALFSPSDPPGHQRQLPSPPPPSVQDKSSSHTESPPLSASPIILGSEISVQQLKPSCPKPLEGVVYESRIEASRDQPPLQQPSLQFPRISSPESIHSEENDQKGMIETITLLTEAVRLHSSGQHHSGRTEDVIEMHASLESPPISTEASDYAPLEANRFEFAQNVSESSLSDLNILPHSSESSRDILEREKLR